MNIYRCNRNPEDVRHTSAEDIVAAMKFFKCDRCKLMDEAHCTHPKMIEEDQSAGMPVEVKKRGRPPKAQGNDPILEELEELANTTPFRVSPSIAPQLIDQYGEVINAARKQGHGWSRIAALFRKHGLRIGHTRLRQEYDMRRWDE